MKIFRGIIEDVLIQNDKFYYPIDFIVIDIQLVRDPKKHTLVILNHPFFATYNAEIFNVRNQTQEDDEVVEVDMIKAQIEDLFILTIVMIH